MLLTQRLVPHNLQIIKSVLLLIVNSIYSVGSHRMLLLVFSKLFPPYPSYSTIDGAYYPCKCWWLFSFMLMRDKNETTKTYVRAILIHR